MIKDNFMKVLLQISNELAKNGLPDLICRDVLKISEAYWAYCANKQKEPEFIGIGAEDNELMTAVLLVQSEMFVLLK
jgi:hypothetical protein